MTLYIETTYICIALIYSNVQYYYTAIFERCPSLETSEIRVSDCSLGEDGIPTPGDTCTVACKNGYVFRSSPIRTCQNDRSWSGAEIVCRGKYSTYHTLYYIYFMYINSIR